MRNRLQLTVVTPDGISYQGEVDGLVALGAKGYFGVRANHAPLIAELQVGDLRLNIAGQWQIMSVSGGLFEVREGQAVVITDAAELADRIDVQRAQAALERAQARLHESAANSEIDVERAKVALARALTRLRVAGGGAIDS
jgi:F-type H+-transporting ATPase subunit epsilon